MIHENYGNDLDMTTDDDDEHHQKSLVKPKYSIPDMNQYDVSVFLHSIENLSARIHLVIKYCPRKC